MKPKNKFKNRFKEAVETTPDIAQCYQTGLQAVKENKIIEVQNERNFQGSVDIDTCTSQKYPQENRWDYVVGYKDHAFYIEVHGAMDSEVETMTKKLQWVKDWRGRSEGLSRIRSTYHWILTKGNSITAYSRWSRKITKAGLYPVKILDFDQVLKELDI